MSTKDGNAVELSLGDEGICSALTFDMSGMQRQDAHGPE